MAEFKIAVAIAVIVKSLGFLACRPATNGPLSSQKTKVHANGILDDSFQKCRRRCFYAHGDCCLQNKSSAAIRILRSKFNRGRPSARATNYYDLIKFSTHRVVRRTLWACCSGVLPTESGVRR